MPLWKRLFSNFQLVKVGWIYFGYYLALGSFMPYINLYYERLGMSGTQIGVLTSIPVIVLSATVLSWGAIADRYHIHKVVLSVGLLVTPLIMLMVSRTQSFSEIAVWVLIFAFFTGPIVPLMDSLALDVAQTRGGSFGAARVWGSIGWAISSWVTGLLVENIDILVLFYGYAVFMWLAFAISLFQPKRLLQAPRLSLRNHLSGFLRMDLLLFLISVFLLAISFSAANTFFSIYMDGIGAGETLIGIAWSVASWTEIPIMLMGGLLLRKAGAARLVAASFVLFALRWLMLSFIRIPETTLVVQLLHGLAFGCFAVGTTTFMSQRSPVRLGATAQALLNMSTWGLGSIAGSLVGGFVYDHSGMPAMFRVLLAFSLAGLALFGIATRVKSSPLEPAIQEIDIANL